MFPVHHGVQFQPIKSCTKRARIYWRREKGNEDKTKNGGEGGGGCWGGKQCNLFDMCQKWRMEKIENRSWDEIFCARVFSNSPSYWCYSSLGRETVAALRVRGAHTSTSSSIQQNKLAATVAASSLSSTRNNCVSCRAPTARALRLSTWVSQTLHFLPISEATWTQFV